MNSRKTFSEAKPKRFDGHLVYSCPECDTDNYISLSEAMTEGFMIVCPDCNAIIKPKTVSKMKCFYAGEKKKRPQVTPPSPPPVPATQPQVKFHCTAPVKDFADVQEVLDTENKSSISSAKIITDDSFNMNDNPIVPDHSYMENSKFAEPKQIEITVLTDHQMSVIKEAVKVLRKYGYEQNAASQLAGDCMRENKHEIGIDMRRLVELCLKKEGANLNEQ